MFTYKNMSNTTKTFYGVVFKPGKTKEVPGIINHRLFVRVNSVPKEPPKQPESKPEPKVDSSTSTNKSGSKPVKQITSIDPGKPVGNDKVEDVHETNERSKEEN